MEFYKYAMYLTSYIQAFSQFRRFFKVNTVAFISSALNLKQVEFKNI